MTIGGSSAEAEIAAITPWPDRADPIGAAERQARLERARALADAGGADGLLLNVGATLRYFAGVPWGPSERLVAMLLPARGRPVLLCPAFELGTLEADLAIDADIRLWEEDEDPIALLADTLAATGITKLGVDPLFPFQWGERLRAKAGGVRLLDGAPAIDGCRMVKSRPSWHCLPRPRR